jgi:hypothetical protein
MCPDCLIYAIKQVRYVHYVEAIKRLNFDYLSHKPTCDRPKPDPQTLLMSDFDGSGAVHTVLLWEAFGDYGVPSTPP